MIDPDIATLLAAAPEFAGRYLDLVREADGDPGAAAAFNELADHVAGLLAEPGGQRPALAACLAAVEEVAVRSPDAEDLVGWSFLDCLSRSDLDLLQPWLGPRTLAILDEMDLG